MFFDIFFSISKNNINNIVYMAALDAFGRLRVAGCFTTFNYYLSPMTNNTSLDVMYGLHQEMEGLKPIIRKII